MRIITLNELTKHYLVHSFLKNRLCVVKAPLRHVAGGLAVEQQGGAGVLVCHLLEDVEGVLVLVPTLKQLGIKFHYTRSRIRRRLS